MKKYLFNDFMEYIKFMDKLSINRIDFIYEKRDNLNPPYYIKVFKKDIKKIENIL